MTLPFISMLNLKQLEMLYNACHDFGTVVSGEFPTLDAVIDARADKRLEARDHIEIGYMKITGRDKCYITFDINEQ